MRKIYWMAGLALSTVGLVGQTFNSGSTGADGALDIQATDARVVGGVFTWNPVRDNLDADSDNVYHFTTIKIARGVQVRIRADYTRKPTPIVWLASGNVDIDGMINVSGENGTPSDVNFGVRKPAIPGPGGYPGAVGVKTGTSPALDGGGPGGGKGLAAAAEGCSAGFVTVGVYTGGSFANCNGKLGQPYGNAALQPLVGGSGGGGGWPGSTAGSFGGGGGAGGGAIRISSSTQIKFGGSASLLARGGTGGGGGVGGGWQGGNGSGGAIHLQAPTITGSMASNCCSDFSEGIRVNGGSWSYCCTVTNAGSEGRIRIDVTNYTLTFSNTGFSNTPTIGPLVSVPLAAFPSIRVVSVNGAAAPVNPTGAYTVPDASFNSPGSVAVVVQGENIPVGTPVKLMISSEGATASADQEVSVTLNASQQATANVTFPQGVSFFYVRAIW